MGIVRVVEHYTNILHKYFGNELKLLSYKRIIQTRSEQSQLDFILVNRVVATDIINLIFLYVI